MASLLEIKGENFHLRRPSAVKGRFVGEDMVFHIGHGRTAEDQHQFGSILVLVNQKLDGGSEAFRRAGDIRVFVYGKNNPFLFGQLEHILQSRLKGQERGFGLHSGVIAQNALAEIFKILLGVAFNTHKINCIFIVNKLADQRCFANTATAIYYYKFKLVRCIQLIQRCKFTFSADKHGLHPPIAATRIAYSITKYSIAQN